MVNLPNVFVPPEFSYLLQKNLYHSKQTNDFLFQYMVKNRAFHMLIINSFIDVDKQKRVDYIIKNLGWKNFRDRLASIYIHYAFDNEFPDETNLNLVRDILEFESKTSSLVVSSESRAFLLAFYLKLSRIEVSQTSMDLEELELTIPDEVLELLNHSKSKLVKIDWLILILWQFYLFVKKDRIESLMAKNNGNLFFDLLKCVPEEEQNKIYTNFLTYSYAISDIELFLEKTS